MRAAVLVLGLTAMVPVVASHRRQRAAGQENDFRTRDGRKVWLLRNVAPLHNGRAVARRCLKISYCRMIESSDGYGMLRLCACGALVHHKADYSGGIQGCTRKALMLPEASGGSSYRLTRRYFYSLE